MKVPFGKGEVKSIIGTESRGRLKWDTDSKGRHYNAEFDKGEGF